MYILYFYLALIHSAGMYQRFQYRFVSVLQLHILAYKANGYFAFRITQFV